MSHHSTSDCYKRENTKPIAEYMKPHTLQLISFVFLGFYITQSKQYIKVSYTVLQLDCTLKEGDD
jgi:hypothetical protein